MTEPSDEDALLAAAQGSGEYPSDRHLLLQEIQSLAKEVARLRGDTKHLNEVVIPKEEHLRRRKVNSALAGLSFLLFAVAAGGLYVQGQQISRTQDAQAQADYEKCVSDQQRLVQQTKGIIEINALLASLRDAQTALAARPDATVPGRQTAAKQSAAYTRYLNFVREQATAVQANPSIKPQDCSEIKPQP